MVLPLYCVAKNANDQTCVVGLVDARANRDANLLARQVADTIAKSFNCSSDRPKYHGARGRSAGDLMY